MGDETKGNIEYGRLLERVDTLCDRVDESILESREARRDHERRLQKLERWRSWLAGAVAALGALFGIKTVAGG